MLRRTIAFLACLLVPSLLVAQEPKKAIEFNRDIRPILSNHCFVERCDVSRTAGCDLCLPIRVSLLGGRVARYHLCCR